MRFGIALVGFTFSLVTSGCNHTGKPMGLTEVKSASGQKASSWKDKSGGTWSLHSAKLEWQDARGQCAKMEGKSRWRLPSPEELLMVRDQGISTSDNKAFGWADLGKVWTAAWESGVSLEKTMLIIGPDSSARYVDMAAGVVGLAPINEPELSVLCVHTDGGGSSWKDAKGNQWWYLTEKMEWPSGEVSCGELAQRTRAPWRLPTTAEFVDAVKGGIQTDANKAFGRDYLTYAWTSEVIPRVDSEEAFAVDLRDGKQHITDVDESLSVVCVRPDKF